MNKYSYPNWNNRQGTIPVYWTETDYTGLPWKTYKPYGKQGFTTQKENWEIYDKRVGGMKPHFEKEVHGLGGGIYVPEDVNKIFGYVLDYFDIAAPIYAFAKYSPGLLLPWHRDNYPTYSANKNVKVDEVIRIVLFLHNPAPGHQLWIEDKLCTGLAGSWYSWQGRTKHMSANLGETDRYVIQITGH